MAKAKKEAAKKSEPKKEKPLTAAIQSLRNYIAMRKKDGLDPTEKMKRDAKLG